MALTKIPASFLDKSAHVDFADNEKAIFGAGSDLQIYHNGTHSYISDNGTGDLYLQGSSAIRLTDPTQSENFAVFNHNGAVNLYHDSSLKFQTTSTGASVTGDLAVSGNLTISGTTTELDTTNLNVTDKNITLNYHASSDTSSNADGAGLTIQDAVDGSNDATLTWNTSLDKFDLSHSLHIGDSNAIGDATTPALQIGGTTTYRLGMYTTAEGAIIDNANGDDGIIFHTKNASEAMRIDASGKVGIGQTVPNSPLEIVKNITFTNSDTFPQLLIRTASGSTGNQLGFGVDEADNLAFIDAIDRGNNVISLVLQRYGGRVGIGTDGPSKTLSVKAPSGSNGGIDVFHNNGNKVAELVHHGSGDEGRLSLYDGGANTVQIHGETGQPSYINSGDVAIGTTVASGRLHVNKNGVGQTIALFSSDMGTWNRNFGILSPATDSPSEPFQFSTGNSFQFTIDGSSALRINSDGGIAIGENNAGYAGQILSVKSGTGDLVMYGESSDASCGISLRDNSSSLNITWAAEGNDHVLKKDTTVYMRVYASDDNLALGHIALESNTSGVSNTGIGSYALRENTSGGYNTAVGAVTLRDNLTGSNLTAVGYGALVLNTASNNTGVGYKSLHLNTTGESNTAVGSNALLANTTAANNTAVGFNSMSSTTTGGSNTALGGHSLTNNTTGSNNTAIGRYALNDNTTGIYNTSVGWIALGANTTGNSSTALGMYALRANTTADHNTAVGYKALYLNTTGAENVAVGALALDAISTVSGNTAVGFKAASACTTGTRVLAVGWNALASATTASFSTAIGYNALGSLVTGGSNCAVGSRALEDCTGGLNTAVGDACLFNVTTGASNTGIGQCGLGLTTGSNNTVLGSNAGNHITTGSNNLCVGRGAGTDSLANITTGSNNIILGNNSITNFEAKVGLTTGSDERDKTDITNLPDNAGLNFVKQMRPVTYVWDNRDNYYPNTHEKYGERDHSKKSSNKQLGFLAQEIKTIENSIGWTDDHIVNTSNEDSLKLTETQLIPILVKAIQELSTTVDELKAEITTLKGE